MVVEKKILVIISLIPIINTAFLTIYGFIFLFTVAVMFFKDFIIEIKKRI